MNFEIITYLSQVEENRLIKKYCLFTFYPDSREKHAFGYHSACNFIKKLIYVHVQNSMKPAILAVCGRFTWTIRKHH